MNPTETAALKPEIINPPTQELVKQVVLEIQEGNPYGFGKYEDSDATVLGLPSLGALRLAHALVKQWMGTPFIPKFIANAPNPAGTFVATVVRGNELGFKMMESLSCLYLSPDGRLGMYGTAMISLMRKSGFKLKFTDLEDGGVEVHGKRPDGDEYAARWSPQDSKTAGITGMHGKYPRYMCKWRAVSDLFRTLASDLSGGPVYTVEELKEDEETIPAPRAPEPENPFFVNLKESHDTQGPAMASAASESPATDSGLGEAAASAVTPQVGKVSANAENQKAGEIRLPPRLGLDKVVVMSALATPYELAYAVLAKEFPEPAQRETMQVGFLRGFTNLTKLPKNHADIIPATILMASMCTAHKAAIIQDPKAAGLQSGVGWKALMALIAAWPEDCKELAKAIAIERYPENPQFLVDYLNEVAEMQAMDEADGRAFLHFFARATTKEARTSLIAFKDQVGLSGLAAELAALGLDLATCSEQELIEALTTTAKDA